MNKPQKKTGELRRFILKNVEKHPEDITAVVAEQFGITRQASHRHIQKLVKEGALLAEGATRDRRYLLKPIVNLSLDLNPRGLEEDKVWREQIRPLLQDAPANVIGICQYGFTEMLNNAIDHSESSNIHISVKRSAKMIEIQIVDNGVGIFNKIQQAFNLDDPLHAILELSKGKLTTDSARHTGEGIFFTSRVFDRFSILSGRLYFAHLEKDSDWLLENKEELFSGTAITMTLAVNSRRTTKEVFDQYTSLDTFGFTKTHVPVFLAAYGDENLISRSQAKRLLARFEKFKEIILDFDNVSMIGQAFADEIFRVYRGQNPQVNISPINANKDVTAMISRARGQ